MRRIFYSNVLFPALVTLLISFPLVTFAAEKAETEADETDQVVGSAVQSETEKQVDERRRKIIEEAVTALEETRQALTSLEENRIDEALDALAITIGKLELIVSRSPDLALAPTGVTTTTLDVYGDPEAIREAITTAEKALQDGKVQLARKLLEGLGSEIIFTVTNLPLATYPDAIKAIVPMIDEGKIKEAKKALEVALNTLVLTNHTVPLPILRSQVYLNLAEELVETTDRSEEENEKLSNHLAAVRDQLEMADLLGYGNSDDYEELHTQLDQIERKSAGGRHGKGFFDKFKSSLSNLLTSITR